MMKHAAWFVKGLAALVPVLLLAGCGAVDNYNDERGKGDAGVSRRDDSPKAVINMPNGFSNVAHSCDGAGHRVFVTTQNDAGKALFVVADESC